MGLVSPSQSNPGDTIEAADINNPINQLAAVVNGQIDSQNLADSSITTAKLADGGVTSDKLAPGAILIGLATKADDFTTSTVGSEIAVPDLSVAVTIPGGSRKVRVTVDARDVYRTTTSGYTWTIWEGPVGSGTPVGSALFNVPANSAIPLHICSTYTPTVGSKTYNLSVKMSGSAATCGLEAADIFPATLTVEVLP